MGAPHCAGWGNIRRRQRVCTTLESITLLEPIFIRLLISFLTALALHIGLDFIAFPLVLFVLELFSHLIPAVAVAVINICEGKLHPSLLALTRAVLGLMFDAALLCDALIRTDIVGDVKCDALGSGHSEAGQN